MSYFIQKRKKITDIADIFVKGSTFLDMKSIFVVIAYERENDTG